MRQSNKVSKKLKLSKSKLNYHKDERRAIHRRERRQAKAEGFEMEISRATQEGDLLILTTDTPIKTPEGWQRVK